MDEFWKALGGGALIGLSAAVLLIGYGKLAGISGTVGGLLRPRPNEVAWRAWFLFGLIGGGLALMAVRPQSFPAADATSGPLLMVAGLLVGFGTRLGGGCTSGHGVCGIGRLSGRSTLATLIFMGTGIATVFVLNHVVGR
jgi:uncharacterized membrane protein YedE/YeeE